MATKLIHVSFEINSINTGLLNRTIWIRNTMTVCMHCAQWQLPARRIELYCLVGLTFRDSFWRFWAYPLHVFLSASLLNCCETPYRRDILSSPIRIRQRRLTEFKQVWQFASFVRAGSIILHLKCPEKIVERRSVQVNMISMVQAQLAL